MIFQSFFLAYTSKSVSGSIVEKKNYQLLLSYKNHKGTEYLNEKKRYKLLNLHEKKMNINTTETLGEFWNAFSHQGQ